MIDRLFHRCFGAIARRCGYVRSTAVLMGKVLPQSKDALLMEFYQTLAHAGFRPKHIVDVGANHGHWTRMARQVFPDAEITMLEPQSWLQPKFQDLLDKDPRIRYFPVGAGRASGSFTFTIAKRDDSSSFRLSPAEAQARGLEQREIRVVTLNELIATNKLPVPDLVKIDAEGLDLEVLEGASELFGRTEVFMVEAAVVNKSFVNSVKAMVDHMDAKGYVLFSITDLNRPFKVPVLWLTELVFVKRGGVLDTMDWLK